jgi:uncharacterized protein (TIGR03790 family)
MNELFSNRSRRSLGLCLSLVFAATSSYGQLLAQNERGKEVVVIYNRSMPESKSLAEYYASKRKVPANQVFGFRLPEQESIPRYQFKSKLWKPLIKELDKAKLLTLKKVPKKGITRQVGDLSEPVAQGSIRYLTLCYGVPSRIVNDPNLKESGLASLKPVLKRNEAAVDSELALLPSALQKLPLYGFIKNSLYAVTNKTDLNPARGILMVTRLDGPTVDIAKGLVDKALEAEKNGLWGQAYFDLRGLKSGDYLLGDHWLRTAAKACHHKGWDLQIDEKPDTLPASFPLSHVGIYAGWYTSDVNGPFLGSNVEFMPGAIAYHLHSFSARSIRTAHQHWVGPLLAKGATATLGSVAEPYLEGTPDFATLLARLLYFRFTFGEAAYACQQSLSWQTTIIGDPLYLPYAKEGRSLHEELNRNQNLLVEWSHARVINLNLLKKAPVSELITYLEEQPITKVSAILQEKLGQLHRIEGNKAKLIAALAKAADLSASAPQKIRVTLELAQELSLAKRTQDAYDAYSYFLLTFPNYPNQLSIQKKLLELAIILKDADAQKRHQEEIKRLSQPPA